MDQTRTPALDSPTPSSNEILDGARGMIAREDDAVIERFKDIALGPIRTLLCDADGNLFPSEEPAFVASAEVVNRLMAELGSDTRYDAEELRLATTGKNFRTTAAELAASAGRALRPEELERWIAEEKWEVTDHLRRTLVPDSDVVGALTRLSERFQLAVVSSSALSRLRACFDVTGLAELLPADRHFSAEDSLPQPTSKPDPAIYAWAAERLQLLPSEGLAIEDSPTGARSAVAAGFQTVGNVRFVAPEERDSRIEELEAAGVCAVVSSWSGLEALLDGSF
jgi:HAD superfamily hydrolase (TIGR01509 family)